MMMILHFLDKKNLLWISCIIGLCYLAYIKLSSIPFLYYESIGIEQNPKLIHTDLFIQSYFSFKSIFYKPLSLLSYYLNHQVCGPSALCFHWTNFFIHASNVLLIFFLLRKLHIKNYILASLIFALHPLSTACVSQIHGRPYALGSFFMLIALNLIFSEFYNNKISKRLYLNIVLTILFFLMFISKQSFIVFPLILLSYLWNTSSQKNIPFLIALLTLCLLFLIGVFYLDIAPNFHQAVVTSKVYAISQLAHVLTLIQFYTLPFQTALVHDLYFYASFNHPQVIFGVCFLIVYFVFIFKTRSKLLAWFLLSFLIMIVPTNSIIPKNEVIREWRLYPSLVFFTLIFGYTLDCMMNKVSSLKHYKKYALSLFYSAMITYICFSFFTIWKQNKIYANPILTWKQVTQHYPHSSDAYNNIGVGHARQKEYKKAIPYFKTAVQLDPKNFAYELNIAAAYRELGQAPMNQKHTQIAKEKASAFNNRSHSFHIKY